MKRQSAGIKLLEPTSRRRVGQFAQCYLISHHWSCSSRDKVEQLLPHISSAKLLGQYAKAREAERSYAKAAIAYEQAKDFDNATR